MTIVLVFSLLILFLLDYFLAICWFLVWVYLDMIYMKDGGNKS